MKQNLKSFFSKQRLILAIAFLLIGTLFVHPFTVYSVDLDPEYIAYAQDSLAKFASAGAASFGFSHFSESQNEGLEVIAFTEKGYIFQSQYSQRNETRVKYEEIVGSKIVIRYAYPNTISYPGYTPGQITYTDYIGFIIKKNGCVVSASLYKIYGFTPCNCGIIEAVCHINYPVLNFLVTETHVKSELRKIALIDRIVTLDSEVNQQNHPNWEDPHLEERTPEE